MSEDEDDQSREIRDWARKAARRKSIEPAIGAEVLRILVEAGSLKRVEESANRLPDSPEKRTLLSEIGDVKKDTSLIKAALKAGQIFSIVSFLVGALVGVAGIVVSFYFAQC